MRLKLFGKHVEEKKEPYNLGDAYEDRVVEIMRQKGFLPPGFKRAGAGTGTDAVFLHQGKKYKLEIKLDLKADYGQRYVKWSEKDGWIWCVNDELSEFYTGIGVLGKINEKNIRPLRYTKPKAEITIQDKRSDQRAFEDTDITVGKRALWDFYEKKDVYYMQIDDGYGFYSLKKDPANLGAPHLSLDFTLRLRCKTIHSKPIYYYGFLAVLKPKTKPKRSSYDLEEVDGRPLPPITP